MFKTFYKIQGTSTTRLGRYHQIVLIFSALNVPFLDASTDLTALVARDGTLK